MTTELIKRLRSVPKVTCTPDPDGSGWKLMTGKYCHDAADALEAMQRELDAANAEISKWRSSSVTVEEHNELSDADAKAVASHFEKQLAARDLVIQQKDDILREMTDPYNEIANDCILRRMATSALSLHPTTSALDAYVAEKVKGG
jgi:hypothetical protein